jgi:hypothetical protein
MTGNFCPSLIFYNFTGRPGAARNNAKRSNARRSNARRSKPKRSEPMRSEAERRKSDAKRRTKPHRSRHRFSIICFSITQENRTKQALTHKFVAQGSRPHAHHDSIPLESAGSQAIMGPLFKGWADPPAKRYLPTPETAGVSSRGLFKVSSWAVQGLVQGLFKGCLRRFASLRVGSLRFGLLRLALLRLALLRFAVLRAALSYTDHGSRRTQALRGRPRRTKALDGHDPRRTKALNGPRP